MRRAGKWAPGPPMQYQVQLASAQLLFALVQLPQSSALQGGVGWAQSGCLQPKRPAAFRLGPRRTTQISQPGSSHHPYPLHLHFPSHPWPWAAESLTVPTQDIQPGLLTLAAICCLDSADQHLHCCSTYTQLWWVTGNHKTFATSTSREQQLQMTSKHSPVQQRLMKRSPLEP